jgi:hypothetical protein
MKDDDSLGQPEASAHGKGPGSADRKSGCSSWGTVSQRLSGFSEAKHRRERVELLEFCRSAATLLAEHKPEASAEGVPIVREEGEPPVEFIQ